MKSLKEFKSSVVVKTVKQFEELFSVNVIDECHEGVTEVLVYADHYYIFVLPNGEYYTEFDRQSHVHPVLARVEEVLWDEYVKFDLNISYDEMEEELHDRARQILHVSPYPNLSLDEALLEEGMTNPFLRQQGLYIMERFSRLSDRKPEPKKQLSPEEIIEFAQEMAQLIFEIYIESSDAKIIDYNYGEFVEPIPVEFVHEIIDNPIDAAGMKASMLSDMLGDFAVPGFVDKYLENGEMRYKPDLRDYDAKIDVYIKNAYTYALSNNLVTAPQE